MIIYLNPGHDRVLDPGAINTKLGLQECDIAYELAEKIKSYIEQNGITVAIGQHDDLYRICDQANDMGADLFVSLHFNAFNNRATGTETLVSGSAASLILGHHIQSRLKSVLALPDRGLKERPGLFVLRNTAMPAVLVEVCFIDNDYDIKHYLDREDAVARAIAEGIAAYTQGLEATTSA